MKILFCTLAVIFTVMCFTMSYAETYTAITKDGEAVSKDAIQVEAAETVTQKTTYTLSYINTQLAVLATQAVAIQAEIEKFNALKAAIIIVVDAVALKVVEPVEVVK